MFRQPIVHRAPGGIGRGPVLQSKPSDHGSEFSQLLTMIITTPKNKSPGKPSSEECDLKLIIPGEMFQKVNRPPQDSNLQPLEIVLEPKSNALPLRQAANYDCEEIISNYILYFGPWIGPNSFMYLSGVSYLTQDCFFN